MTTTFTTNLVNNLNKVAMENSYSQNGWKGMNYESSLTTSDMTKIMRQTLKQQYPDCKFSVTKQHVGAICISLMSAPFNVFETPDVNKASGHDLRYGEEDFMNSWKRTIERGSFGVNHYYITESKFLTEKAKEVMTFCKKLADSFNFDDSDVMTDYFNTNFYLTLEIGKWSKPFIKTN